MTTKRQYGKYLQLAYRADGTGYTCKTDDCPQDLERLIYAIHDEFDAMPNDWIYNTIANAFEAMEEEDCTWEDCSIEADVYNSDLYTWFGEPYAATFIEEYVNEFSETKDIYTMIAGGQWRAMERICMSVIEFINEATNE